MAIKNLKLVALCVSAFVLCVGVIILYYSRVWGAEDKVPFVEGQLYSVTHVLDGDTFKVLLGDAATSGKEITIRMLGINTPETVDPRKPPECFGKEASDQTKSLLEGRRVKFVLSPKREVKDRYSRYLAYVYRDDGLFVNELLLEQGFAREYTYGKPYSEQRNFKKFESSARTQKLGLWGRCVATK